MLENISNFTRKYSEDYCKLGGFLSIYIFALWATFEYAIGPLMRLFCIISELKLNQLNILLDIFRTLEIIEVFNLHRTFRGKPVQGKSRPGIHLTRKSDEIQQINSQDVANL